MKTSQPPVDDRRKLQNRLAQRRNRHKTKQKIADLENRLRLSLHGQESQMQVQEQCQLRATEESNAQDSNVASHRYHSNSEIPPPFSSGLMSSSPYWTYPSTSEEMWNEFGSFIDIDYASDVPTMIEPATYDCNVDGNQGSIPQTPTKQAQQQAAVVGELSYCERKMQCVPMGPQLHTPPVTVPAEDGSTACQLTDPGERLESILGYTRSLGYSNFDDVVEDYYTASFKNTSAIRHMQRTSRSRRLRGVMKAIAMSSRAWSTMESQGYRDELLRAAEDVYSTELNAVYEPLQRTLHNLDQSTTLSPKIESVDERMLLPLKELLEDNVPHLFDLMTHLSRRNEHDKIENPGFALAIIGMLGQIRRAGKVGPWFHLASGFTWAEPSS